LKEKCYDPLDFRYLTLGTHYRTPLNFTFEAMDNAKNSFNHLKDKILEIKDNLESKGKTRIKSYQNNFLKAINDDLNLPKGLAVMRDVIKDSK
jgi:cysteinyl-tRNA synthetase